MRRAGVFEGEGEADVAAGGLGAQYARALQAGSAAASGGCTDAGVRLGALLSVRAPAGRLVPSACPPLMPRPTTLQGTLLGRRLVTCARTEDTVCACASALSG